MKNFFVFLRFTITTLIICLIYDIISNKKIEIDTIQILTSVIISIIVGGMFTAIFFIRTYSIETNKIDLVDLKEKMELKSFKLVEQGQNYMRFRGSKSYLFYVGDIDVNIYDDEINIIGTKYIINKIINS